MSQRTIDTSVDLVVGSFVERLNAEDDNDRAVTTTDLELHKALLKVLLDITKYCYLRKIVKQ